MISKVSVFISGALLLAERGYLPDALLRSGIRRLCRNRLAEIEFEDKSTGEKRIASFVDTMNHADIAPIPHKANQQHYEVPSDFFSYVLGSYMKYSCCLFEEQVDTLDVSEEEMLSLYCERASLENGQTVLDLGCGDGRNMPFFRDLGLEVFGVEINKDIVELCRAHMNLNKMMLL